MKREHRLWTDDELDLLVEEYHRILWAECEGREVNKRQAATELAAACGRTRCSVEYMWQNVSYVRETLGKTRIAGYVPRGNCGDRLRLAVLRGL